jgi:hypothetical protein
VAIGIRETCMASRTKAVGHRNHIYFCSVWMGYV